MTTQSHNPDKRQHATRRLIHSANPLRLTALAVVLLVLTGGLSGCDLLDSNRADEVTLNTKFVPDLEKPEFLGPPVIDVPWLSLVASWRLDRTGALQSPMVTFSVKQKVTVETTCYDYHGRFKATGAGQLAILKLVPDLEGKRCDALVEDPLIAALEAATHYKFAEAVLLIYSKVQEEALAFQAEAAAFGEDEPKDDGAGDDGSGDDQSEDKEEVGDDGAGDDGAGDESEDKEEVGDDGAGDEGAGDESEDKEEVGDDGSLVGSDQPGDDGGSLVGSNPPGGDDGGSGDGEPKEESGDEGDNVGESKKSHNAALTGSERSREGGALTDKRARKIKQGS